jgi:hypothetical protein
MRNLLSVVLAVLLAGALVVIQTGALSPQSAAQSKSAIQKWGYMLLHFTISPWV